MRKDKQIQNLIQILLFIKKERKKEREREKEKNFIVREIATKNQHRE